MACMMSDCGLMDLDSIGGRFTWRKNIQQGGHVRKKLDRCMVDVAWRLLFQHALVEVLNQHNSDHNSLLLSCMKYRSTKEKVFHFQAAWIQHPDYGNLVEQAWQQTGGNAVMKLSGVRDQSTIFNKQVFGNIFLRKRLLEARIKGVHSELDVFPYSSLIRL